MKFEDLLISLGKVKKVIISDRQKSLNGIDFVNRVSRVAAELELIGINDRKIVLLRMINSVDYVVLLFALLKNKSTVFVANPHDPIQKTCQVVNRFRPFAVIADNASSKAIQHRFEKAGDNSDIKLIKDVGANANIFKENDVGMAYHSPQTAEADIAIFSSGSTGAPKAILHTVENVLNNAIMHAESVGLESEDRVGLLLPLYYSYGLVANLLGSLVKGAHVDLHVQAGAIDENWIVDKNISALSVTPYFARTLTRNIPGLRILTLGGDILHAKQAIALMDEFESCNFFTTYGLTEAGPRVATWKFERDILEVSTVLPLGKPLKGVDLRLDFKVTDSSTTKGELIVNTPTRMLGYFYGVDEGFFMPDWSVNDVHTEDLFEMRSGDLFFAGRMKNVIVQGGEKIFPVAIESAIQSIEGVIEVTVDSLPDEDKGRIARAKIVANENVSLNVVRKTLLGQFSRSVIPEKIEFVESISRTLTGKVA